MRGPCLAFAGLLAAAVLASAYGRFCERPPVWTASGVQPMINTRGKVTVVALLLATWPMCQQQATGYVNLLLVCTITRLYYRLMSEIGMCLYGHIYLFFLSERDEDSFQGLMSDYSCIFFIQMTDNNVFHIIKPTGNWYVQWLACWLYDRKHFVKSCIDHL